MIDPAIEWLHLLIAFGVLVAVVVTIVIIGSRMLGPLEPIDE